MQAQDALILIPSLHPDDKLVQYVDDLVEHGFRHILVVDDGSGPSYQPLFDQVAAKPGCQVIGYPKNQGKGHALKHGMAWVQKHLPDVPGVVTADSDGQHTAEDCLKVARAMLQEPGKLVLGSRDFSQKDVPFKSRTGNRLTSFFFALLYGQWLGDTQTGLRGISRQLLNLMQQVPGERFEYEMNMLIHASGKGISFSTVSIHTIYHDANAGTHFRPFQDGMRIYKQLFKNFFKFASASALSTLLDVLLFTLLVTWLLPRLFPGFVANAVAGRDYGLVLAATAIARLCSAILNYRINRQFVFRIQTSKGAFLRYSVLVVLVILASSSLVYFLNSWLGLHETLAKMLVDTGLFFINYRIMKAWVFKEPEGEMSV